MMGLPLDDRAFLLPRAEIAVRSNDVELKTKTQLELAGYLMGHIEDRKANRRDDLLGMIVNGEVEDRPLTPHEIMAMSLLVLVGRSDEHTSELQSLMRNCYAVVCL